MRESTLQVIGSSLSGWKVLEFPLASMIGFSCGFCIVKNVSAWDIIMSLTPVVNSFTCFRRYNRNASLFHRPSNMMVDVRAWARCNSIAQLVLREWVPTLFSSIPSEAAPNRRTVSRRCCRTCLDVIRTSLFVTGFRNVLTVVFSVAFL